MSSGFLSIILHAHLPFVKDIHYKDSLEQRWLFQAITDTYIPLLNCLFKLSEDSIPYRIAVSLSPPLLEMLNDEVLKIRYERYLHNLIALSEKETFRTSYNYQLQDLAHMYLNRFKGIYKDFTERYKRDLIKPWSALESTGNVELLTSAATHGYLPLLIQNESINAQIKTGVQSFRRHFGHNPSGFWLPECAYTPEVEPCLKKEGISYFIMETHGIMFASPRPKFGYHAPIVTPGGLLAFGRDPDCSKQVWSADEGYPGDPRYRDFYRDIGYDLPMDYLGESLPGNYRMPVGIKYHKITDRSTMDKQLYEPREAQAAAWEHAGNFIFWRNKEAEYWKERTGRRPVMIAPYDGELFGHWWYEGPLWLENLFRRMNSVNQYVIPLKPSDYVNYYPVNQKASPERSSWGYKGYHEVWLEASNDWIYRHLHACQDMMKNMVAKHPESTGLIKRALDQAARELLLAQSSDWPFIMKTGTVPGYAKQRFTNHIARFLRLIDEVKQGAVDPLYLDRLERYDSIFPEIDYRAFCPAAES